MKSKEEIFVEVFERLDYDQLCTIAAQALLRAIEQVPEPNQDCLG